MKRTAAGFLYKVFFDRPLYPFGRQPENCLYKTTGFYKKCFLSVIKIVDKKLFGLYNPQGLKTGLLFADGYYIAKENCLDKNHRFLYKVFSGRPPSGGNQKIEIFSRHQPKQYNYSPHNL